jgi:hypothetical protein
VTYENPQAAARDRVLLSARLWPGQPLSQAVVAERLGVATVWGNFQRARAISRTTARHRLSVSAAGRGVSALV